MPTAYYTLNKLEEIYGLSIQLSHSFPDPLMVQPGIYELLINALEHGNLGIGEQLKTLLISENRWEEEVRRRMAIPEFSGRQVDIALEQTDMECRITIADQGRGFNWRHYMDPYAVTRDKLHGLGLLLVRHAGFDSIAFNEKGTEVSCTVRKRIA